MMASPFVVLMRFERVADFSPRPGYLQGNGRQFYHVENHSSSIHPVGDNNH